MSNGNQQLAAAELSNATRRFGDLSRDEWTLLAAGGLIFVVTLGIYFQVWEHEFIIVGDPGYIIANPVVNEGVTVTGLRSAFLEPHRGNWHPITWLSHMIDRQYLGLDAGWHHLVNAVLHAINALLLMAALRFMTGSVWAPVAVAAMFALHPLRVESVAWAAQRKDVLAGFFWMLTLLAYTRYVKRRGVAAYLMVLVALALGLLTKPMLVTLPCVLLLLDFWPFARWRLARTPPDRSGERLAQPLDVAPESLSREPLSKLILEKLPMFAMAVGVGVITLQIQHGGSVAGSLDPQPVAVRLANALVAYVVYMGKLVWPADLALFYPHAGILYADPLAVLLKPAILSGLLLASITIGVCWMGRRCGYLPVGWFWFLGTLIPASGIVQAGSQALADRFTYLPMIGLYLAIAWGMRDAVANRPRLRAAVAVASVAVLLCWATVTWFQLRHWKNSVTLFLYTSTVTTENTLLHGILGTALWERGYLQEAIPHLEKALDAGSNEANLHYRLAVAYQNVSNDRDALLHYRKTMEFTAATSEVTNSLAWLLATSGDASVRDGKEAVGHARRAAEATNYLDANILDTLAAAYAESGDFEQAVKWQTTALKMVGPWQSQDFFDRLVLYRSGEAYHVPRRH